MKNLRQKNAFISILLFDLLVITVAFASLLYIDRKDWFVGMNPIYIGLYLINYQFKSYILLLLSWFLVAEYTVLYKESRFARYLVFIRRSIFQCFIFGFILFAISGIKNENLFTNTESSIFIAVVSIYVLFSRSLMFLVRKYLYRKGFNRKKIVIIGYNDNASEIVNFFSKRKDYGISVTDIFVTKESSQEYPLLDINTFESYLAKNKIDYAYICLASETNEITVNQIIEILEKQYVSIGFIPNNSIETKQILEINYLDTFPILTYKKYPLDHSLNQIVKRTFDLVFAFFVFVFVLSWAYPIISLLVLIYQGRPVHFSQKRNGLNGKEFNCLKFRSMRDDKNNSLKPTERDDPRVTKLGRILRKTSLDELPQFINVLKGEMSIVGPRPHMVSENESYSDIIKRYSLRHYVKPGITGLAQTKGYRGAVDSDRDMEMRIRTDIYYVRNWSFLLDILIIFRTVKLMIFGDENAI